VLPIHAAGDHVEAAKTGIACTVMDRVISSYTPTLRALQFARQRQTAISQRKEGDSYLRALLVHMSKTPNMVDLEQATQEADRVKLILTNQVTRGHIPITQLPEPHYKTVLEHLQVSTIAHFACHAVVDTEDPSKSHLRLRDWGTSPLEVATLMNLDLSDCQLVYLSACETAVNKNSKLREEGLHISGGFQMAGVPNTIATWWEIEDRHPVDVATSFYGGLINEGSIDLTACASSLHQAVRGLRNLRIEPIVWAAYVHYGA
jgi:CHAT domain-containing protein